MHEKPFKAGQRAHIVALRVLETIANILIGKKKSSIERTLIETIRGKGAKGCSYSSKKSQIKNIHKKLLFTLHNMKCKNPKRNLMDHKNNFFATGGARCINNTLAIFVRKVIY